MSDITLFFIDFVTLFSIGIILIALEIFVPNFIIIWFGIGFMIGGCIQYLMHIENIYLLYSLIFIISSMILGLFLIYKKYFNPIIINQTSNDNIDFFNEEGKGNIINNLLSYKGSYFNYIVVDEFHNVIKNKISFINEEEVKVVSVYGNEAKIQKIINNE